MCNKNYKNGIKIMSLEGAEINEYSIGVRKNYKIKEAVLSYSLLQEKLINKKYEEHIEVNKGKTRDIINIKFGFGSQDAEGEIKRLNKAIKNLDPEKDSDKILFMEKLKEDIINNKHKYVKKTVDQLRNEMYKNGFSLTFKDYPQLTRNSKCYNKNLVKELKEIKSIKDKKIRSEKYKNFYDKLDNDKDTIKSTIKYKMLFRSPAKARVGEIIFIKEELYESIHSWMCMDLQLPEEKAKIVEMSAYSSLVSSTIVDKINIDVDDILILKDLDSITQAMVKTVNVKDGKCVVDNGIKTIKNTLWDGMGLIESSLMEGKGNGMLLIRQHFFKACLFNTNIQKFFKDYYKDNYETATIKDMFGVEHQAKDIKVITTDNAIKWLKFKDLMGDTDKEAYEYWVNKIKAENSDFGICKTDHPSKLNINDEVVQQMSYQMVNTLPINKEGIESVAKTSYDYVNKMKDDNKLFIDFLEQNKNFSNKNEMMIDLYNHNKNIEDTNLFREWKSDILIEYKAKLKKGKILTHGDNLTVCGNPYMLLEYAVGKLNNRIKDEVIEEKYEDITLPKNKDYIGCYAPMFKDNEELAGFRNPHNSPNNIMYFKNVKHEIMDKYFNFTDNIIAVNLLNNDAQDRANGFDEDSDFFYITNDSTITKCAKECYQKYKTIVNNIPKDKKTYNNTLEDYAKMDSVLMESKNTIGETSNLAQLALSYYWTEKNEELYDNFVILSVLSQVAIDNSKRKYSVDVAKEIKRIRAMKCMNRNKPSFWKSIKKNKDKNGKKKIIKIDKDIICPMNFLGEVIDGQIKNASTDQTTDILDFIVKYEGKAKKEQMEKIISIVKEYDDFVKENKSEEEDEWFDKLKLENDETIDKLSKFKITDKTLNMLIVNTIKKKNENAKYRDKLLNCLYITNKKEFLKQFKMKKGENENDKVAQS